MNKARKESGEFSKKLSTLSTQELRELVMINAYKLEVARSQIDSIVEVLIKKKVSSYEEIWKLTNKRMEQKEVEEQ